MLSAGDQGAGLTPGDLRAVRLVALANLFEPELMPRSVHREIVLEVERMLVASLMFRYGPAYALGERQMNGPSATGPVVAKR